MKSNPSDPAFPPTRWSLVLDFRDGDDQSRSVALSELCEAYWYPAYAFVRRSGKQAEDAQDLTQGFFLDFLERESFSKADPQRGRMRTFLLTALKRYLAKTHQYRTRQKRGSGFTPISIDECDAEGRYLAEPSDTMTPDLLFERRWADALFRRALIRLRAHFVKTDRLQEFETLNEFLPGKTPDLSYAEAAKILNRPEEAIPVNVFRMRKRLRKIIEEEIRETLATPEDFEDELNNLYAIFQSR